MNRIRSWAVFGLVVSDGGGMPCPMMHGMEGEGHEMHHQHGHAADGADDHGDHSH